MRIACDISVFTASTQWLYFRLKKTAGQRHPNLQGSEGTELTVETSHRGPSIDLDGRQLFGQPTHWTQLLLTAI